MLFKGLLDLDTSSNLIFIISSDTLLLSSLTASAILANSRLTKLNSFLLELTDVINSFKIFFCSGNKSLYLELNFSKSILNVNNFKLFTDINYVRANFHFLLNPSRTSLTDSNQKVLNRYLYKNMFPNTSNKKKKSKRK